MYHEVLEETDKIKSEYEAKLIEANDTITTSKAENEALKEKVDILFKLGKSYLDRVENTKASDDVPGDLEIQVIEDETHNNDLGAWTTNKLRGFKRIKPGTKAKNQNQATSSTSPSHSQESSNSSPPEPHPTPPTPHPLSPTPVNQKNNERVR